MEKVKGKRRKLHKKRGTVKCLKSASCWGVNIFFVPMDPHLKFFLADKIEGNYGYGKTKNLKQHVFPLKQFFLLVYRKNRWLFLYKKLLK